MRMDAAKAWLRPLPQWSPVAIAPGRPLVAASLHGEGMVQDVSADHTVASLKPLTIASSLDAGPRPLLEYRDAATKRLLGALHLVRVDAIDLETAAITLYRVADGEHRCLSWPRRPWNAWLQNRAMRKNRAPGRLAMAPAAVQQLMIAYLYPRPVVLVSVQAEGHRNIFPMDLIGPLERSGLFSLALRNTNVSEPVIREARRVVLSGVPAAMKDEVYRLSAHHQQPLAAWSELPFAVRPSRQFGIPMVAAALRGQELAIVASRELGSHTLFLARVAGEEPAREGEQLHHTAGFHQACRHRQGRPFVEV